MNLEPQDAIRLSAEALRGFAFRALHAAGLVPGRSELLARLLVENDLRGVNSHGTARLPRYCHDTLEGILNPDPAVRVVRETPSSLLVDGDGGLGYFPAYEGTLRLIDKALAEGIAVLMTRNHNHIGAAGIYSRMTLPHDLLCYVTSGHQLRLQPGDPIHAAAGGSPMSFSAPAEEEAPLVLDFGAMHDLYRSDPHRDEIAALAPGLVLRSIGLGVICQAWGGLLSGLTIDPDSSQRRWAGGNQGALIIALRIDLFMDPAQYRREIDEYVRAARRMAPLPGFQPYLPGGPEAEKERRYAAEGIPIGEEHRRDLETLADELHLRVPWRVDRTAK